jgi:hypothetical protein
MTDRESGGDEPSPVVRAARPADAARAPIPETVEHVSDTGANRVPVAGEPDFVMRVDLTGEL